MVEEENFDGGFYFEIYFTRTKKLNREREDFLEIDIKKSFNYDRLISPLVIIYQL